ncbi:unnamed protein product [Miscanthus lutarioriparius]|uniref:Uncharacterized protein n=1 Tax=Miscanthus lutarioriparius TaxID=422564 RepID=A0A811MPL6_9POAL|nr:unnamed protein product [Miscanthus lutarioriparius]
MAAACALGRANLIRAPHGTLVLDLITGCVVMAGHPVLLLFHEFRRTCDGFQAQQGGDDDSETSVHFQTPVVSWYYQDGEKICILLPIDKSWLAPVGKTPMVADKAANLKRQGSQGIGKGGNQNYRFSYEIYTLMHLKDFCKVLT